MNASLNGSCALLLLLGWWLIRDGNVRGHATAMVLAVVDLRPLPGCYLVYHYKAGSMPFRASARSGSSTSRSCCRTPSWRPSGSCRWSA